MNAMSFKYYRSLRYGHSIRSHAHNTKNAAPSELPLPQTSTLRSRRRLARLLVAGSFVFVFCWSPHVIFLICTKWSATETYSKTMASYSLFFGKWIFFALFFVLSLSMVFEKCLRLIKLIDDNLPIYPHSFLLHAYQQIQVTHIRHWIQFYIGHWIKIR